MSIKAALASSAIMRAGVVGLTLTGTFVAAPLAIMPAFADGGQGGAPALGGSGGAGGTATAPTGGHGSDEDLVTIFGGGGGGGGGVSLSTGAGGAGGTGGTVQSGSGGSAGGDGGSGGNFGLVIPSAPNVSSVSGTVGGAGGNSAPGGGGGGGGGEGGGGLLFTGGAASSNASIIAGGNGGNGGDTGDGFFTSGSGGSGGAGGVGVALTAGANFTNSAGATVQGGAGGAGGAAGFSVNDVAGNGGNGGNGGTGVLMVSGGTLTNAGTITGGAAGAGGLGGAGLFNGANGVSGVGGTGASGANITVVNSGTIAGGSGGLAVAFTGGTNTLELRAGSTITGNVVAFSSADTLRLGGSTNATFDVSTMGAAAQYRGFGIFEKAGSSTWTLTGTNTFGGSTVVNGGTLLAGNAGAFSATSAMTINGGTVGLGGTAQTINNVALAGGVLSNGALTGAVTSTGGTLSRVGGSMSLTANGGVTHIITLNTYTGATTVNNGATLLGASPDAFSAASVTTINTGGTVNLGGFGQAINNVALAGGTLRNGALTSAVISIDGDLVNVGGDMSLTTNSGTTTVSGTNTYTGATTVNNGATLTGSGVNAFSAASSTTIGIGGVVNLGGVAQTINSVALAGGRLSNGFLTGAVTSTGGAIASVGGSMNLTANGGTTMFLAVNTYTGATVVNNGATLFSVVDNSFSAASAMTINTGGTLNLGGTAQTINAVALAGGTLKSGLLNGAVTSTGGTLDGLRGGMSLTTTGGVTTVTGPNAYTGATIVNGGLLSVNGSIVSDVTVNAGGTLGGNGIVGNTTINGGALAPGNSIGLLTVQGSLTFNAAASYMVQVSPASADRTNVTGAATLGGATVNASFAPGAYVAKQYTIVHADAGVHDRFSSLVNTDLPSGFTASLSYGIDDAYLDLALSFVPPGTGLNTNQQNVGNAIVNFFNSTGGIPIVFGSLTPAGLTQLSGEAGTGSQQTTFNAMNQFIGVMTDPFVAGRADGVSAGGTASGYADEEALAYAQKRKPGDALAAIYTKAPLTAPAFEQRWSVWAAAFGGSQSTDGNAALGSNNTTSSIYGTAVGADYRVSPDTLAGFAIAGGGTNFSVASNLGGGRSDLFQAGAFIRHNAGAAYLTGALAYGWQDITTDRTVTVAGADRLRAEFKANAWSGRLEGGYRFVTQGFGLAPYAAGQFTTFELPSYAEQAIVGSNIFALAYNSKSVTDTRSELGLRADRSFVVNDAILTLRGRAAWAHDFNTDRIAAATFQALPGASFVVNGAAQAHELALATASAEMKFRNGLSLAATFEGEFSDVSRSYAGKGVVRYAW
ncbi:autotransporter domain-containing protein [Bradyrhizobium sp. SSUT18]|uniref:autotransporter outer membrane beta-barrel domain-containing protein n=1 Tax=unclassified Bradyrhizobium TaxID=2631580 RepID=UPI002449086B|nr:MULTISPECIES: autotransporter domain-containing protein [unclassified Bradyrhizobium]MDH2353990.1 autotransporter domain-containing protein [Bradyrhizobium sp. SSUT112]MDH2404799.1 autotransporter domain-containing protein [Bradyrhizobium sp. SSUT18]